MHVDIYGSPSKRVGTAAPKSERTWSEWALSLIPGAGLVTQAPQMLPSLLDEFNARADRRNEALEGLIRVAKVSVVVITVTVTAAIAVRMYFRYVGKGTGKRKKKR